MTRIKISPPEKFVFSTIYTVSISDINYGNHLGNDRLLSIAHESRIRFFKELGIRDELKVDGDVGIIMADAAIVYKGESFHGDELAVEIGIADTSKYGFDLVYRIRRTSDEAEIAWVKTGIVTFDYISRKVSPVPENFLKLISS